MKELENCRVAIIATDGVEEVELVEPRRALDQAGARTELIAPKPGEIQGFKHHDKSSRLKVDRTLEQANPEDYDAVLLPGGALNADEIRVDERLKRFLRAMQEGGKPLAVICHAPWELISAGLAKGRRLTSFHTIQDDLRNAGAEWEDREVVVDDNLVTSRKPDDLPAFNREMIKLFGRRPAAVR
ncbi:MAG: protease [Gemmatimonadales bacterium]|nr:protease [Gemmatimonadales bacterium]